MSDYRGTCQFGVRALCSGRQISSMIDNELPTQSLVSHPSREIDFDYDRLKLSGERQPLKLQQEPKVS